MVTRTSYGFRARVSFLVVGIILVLSACSDNNNSHKKSNPAEIQLKQGKLVEVTDEAELNQFLKQGLLNSYSASSQFTELALASAEDEGVNSVTDSDSASENFSGTYTLEANVDEADIVKYDGDYLFIAEQPEYFCCTIMDSFAPQQPVLTPAIRVLSTSPTTPSATEITTLTPTVIENSRITGLYQKDDILVSLATTSSYGFYGEFWVMPWYWQQGKTSLSLFDISDIQNVSESWNANIDGNLVSSRRIGDTLYLITRYTPDLQLKYSLAEGDKIARDNSDKVDTVELSDLLPKVEHDSVKSSLFSPTDCYLGNTDITNGYSVITTITAIPLDSPDQYTSRCYNGETQGIYVSEQAIYISFFNWQVGKTWIHKFALDNNAIEYRGTGEVDGSLSYRLDADFYMSEYNGDLRVITSEWKYSDVIFLGATEDDSNDTSDIAPPEVVDNIDHKLTILRESDTEKALEVISTLPNENRTQELGKPNETLYGVRFYNDRAYIVTFERVDPLYILDLSDPLDPFIAGELELPGFSDFLHPISDSLLLGVGKNVDDQGGFSLIDGIKVELFDVSSPASPASLGAISIGDRGTGSQVFSNRHAFTYLEMSASSHRFTLPIDRYLIQDEPPEQWSWGQWQDTGLYLFEINNVDTPSTATLTEAGSMVVDSKTDEGSFGYPEYYENRSVLHDDAVFYIYGDEVWSAFWNNAGGAENIAGPF